MSDTPITIVDEHDNILRQGSKDEAQTKGLWHRVVRVMVEDEDGHILIQKRNADKQLYPGCWDNSAAGHVDAGESYRQAAKRELHEEIGITPELLEVDYYQAKGVFHGRKLNRFVRLYKAVVPHSTSFTIQKAELSEVKWVTLAELRALVGQHPHQASDGLHEVCERLYT